MKIKSGFTIMKEVLSTNPIKYNVWEKRFVDLEDLIEVRDMIGSMCQKDMLPHLFQNQNKSNIVYSIYQRINQALIDLDSDISTKTEGDKDEGN